MSIVTILLANGIALVSSIFLSGVIYYCHRRTPFKGYGAFMGLTLCVVLWTAFFLFELTVPGLEAKLMMIKVEYFGIAFFPLFFTSYLLDTAEYQHRKSNWIKGSLGVFGLIYVICAWTNPFNQFYIESKLVVWGGQEVITHTYGFLLYLMHGILSFAVLCSAGSLIVGLIQGKTAPKRAWPLLVGSLLPYVLNIFYVFKLINFDPTNMALGISAAIIAVFMFLHGEIDTKKYIVHNIIELMTQPVILLDSNQRVIYLNEMGEKTFGILGENLSYSSLSLNDLIPECPDIENDKRTYYEFKIANGDSMTYFEMYYIPLKLRDSQSSFLMINDITSKKQISDQLNYLRDWDTATGLINANRFMRILAEYRKSHDQGLTDTGISFMGVVNLDVIKAVMPMEHEHLLCKEIARIINSELPKDAIIAYFGNFEFAIFRHSWTSERTLEWLKRRYAYMTITVGDYTYSVEMCLGQYNIESDVDVAKAIGDATFTMRSVLATSSFYRVYDPPLNTTLDISKELMKDLSLERVEKWFSLVYQPVVDIIGNQVLGAEALLRWTHPTMGAISPAIFIPIAERTNAIFILGELVIRKCCDFLTQYKNQLPPNFRILVNISKREIDDDAHINKLIHIIIDSYVPFSSFEFEITETIAARNIEQVIAFTKTMTNIGARIALDDFGSGNTALAYISDLNCNTVKIDTSMSDGAMGDIRRTKLLSSISNMCHDMELDTIMEHVETYSTMEYFADCGYRLVQGYLFSKPLAPDELALFVANFDVDNYRGR